MNTLGERILYHRKLNKFSQEKLGNLVGLDQTVISKLERGETHESSKIVLLAKALKVDAYWLLTGRGNKDPADPQETQVIEISDPVLNDLAALEPEDADVWRAQIRAAAIKARRQQKRG